jgi:hypothetical protein
MSYSLNGTDQRLITGNIYGNSPLNITMSIWARSNGPNANNTLWAHTSGSNLLFRFILNASNQAEFYYRDSNGIVQASIARPVALNNLTWYHWCVTINATEGAKFYIDGVLVGSDATVSMSNNNPEKSSIGVNDANGTGAWQNHWFGNVAEAAIWTETINSSEIVSLSKGMTCEKVRPQGLVFYAPLTRDLIDIKRGLAITNDNNATVAENPRVYA